MEHTRFWVEFFHLYKEMPALWRVGSTAYTDRGLKSECYSKLVDKLRDIYPDADRDMVVKKINNFRTCYRKELKRMIESKEMGKTYKPTLWYFDCFRFLSDYDEVGMEKTINEYDNTEEPQQTQDVANTMTYKKLPTKHNGNFNDSDQEYLPSSNKRKIMDCDYQTKQSKKPSSYEERQQAKVDADMLAKSWGVQYKELQGNQKLVARKLISDILFYGCIGALEMSHIIDLQEMFQNESTESFQHSNLQPHSSVESNSSFLLAEKEQFNNDTARESPVDFNSSSPFITTASNSVIELPVIEIKSEMP